jgi:acetolactate synthase-1/2/3 large subunit
MIFGYPGGQIINVYDNLYDFRDRLTHILARHEQGAVHAAQGYARATGRTGVCLVTSGPGATNLVTGIADAMIDSTPLVCISGQVPSTLLGTDAFQEADIISMTMPVTKWNFQVTSPSEIPEAIAKAFYIARSGRPGPALIDITKNAQIGQLEYAYKPCLGLRSYTPRPEVEMAAAKEATEMINRAERPLILAGQGIKLAGAEQALLEFAETGNIPVATTLMGISAIPSRHPLFAGSLGMHGNIAANAMTQTSDLLVAIGMRFSDRVTGNVASYAPEAKIIHIDIDRSEIGKNIRCDMSLTADAGDALEAMKVGLRYVDRTPWFGFASAKRREEDEKVVARSRDASGRELTMPHVIQTLADIVDGEAIIVTDVGQNQMFSARYSRFNHTRSFITSGGLGTMGFGLPAAIGAKLGASDRQVIAALGDGGLQMTIQELGTIMQNRIGVKILALNNAYLGMVRQWQQLFFNRRYSFTELENPDFAQIAAAYRIPAERISQPEELEGALRRMVEAEGPYLLEATVRGEDNVFPMVPAGASLSESIYTEP